MSKVDTITRHEGDIYTSDRQRWPARVVCVISGEAPLHASLQDVHGTIRLIGERYLAVDCNEFWLKLDDGAEGIIHAALPGSEEIGPNPLPFHGMADLVVC